MRASLRSSLRLLEKSLICIVKQMQATIMAMNVTLSSMLSKFSMYPVNDEMSPLKDEANMIMTAAITHSSSNTRTDLLRKKFFRKRCHSPNLLPLFFNIIRL